MNMRPKTVRRVSILIGIFVLVLGVVFALWLVSQKQRQAKIATERAAGLEAFARGDYPQTMGSLGKYFTLDPTLRTDAEALFAYGKARAKVEEVNDKHVLEGKAILEEYVNLHPPDTDQARILDAQHILLDLYTKAAYSHEALTLSEELLAKNPNDVDAIRAKAFALYRVTEKKAEALEALTKLNELAPQDLMGQRLRLILTAELTKSDEQVLARAADLRKQFPEDPRFILLQGFAHLITRDVEEGRKWLIKAAESPAPDVEYVRTLIDLFDNDRIEMYDQSRALLERAASQIDDPSIKRMLVQRMWQSGDYESVVQRLSDLDPTDKRTRANLLAYRALSLYQLDRAGEAGPIVDALAERKDDSDALAWATALRARFGAPNNASGAAAGGYEPRAAIENYRNALVRDPRNDVIRFMMGEAYARLGEQELALSTWRQVAERNPSWAMPQVMIAQLLASTGRIDDAFAVASLARKRLGRNPTVVASYLALGYRVLMENGETAKADTLAADFASVQKAVPGEPQTWPIYVALLARTDKVFTAKAELKKAMEMPRPPAAETLIRLASASRQGELGMENELLAYCEKVHGNTPQLASARASALHEAGKPAEGLQLLEASAANAQADESAALAWQLMITQYREATRDPSALQTWIKLADANPKHVQIQNAVLDARTTWADRQLIARTIERVKELTGDDGIAWKLARAAWLLGGSTPGGGATTVNAAPANDRDVAEAINLLNDIVRSAPTLVRPRLLLARALREVNNPGGAVQQLKAAAELNPRSPEIAVDFAQILQLEGRVDEARAQLNRIANNPTLTNEQRTRVAALLAQLGDNEAALKLLKSIDAARAAAGATTRPTDTSSLALEAEINRRQGKLDEADRLYQQLLADPNVEVTAALSAVDFYAQRGQQEKAAQALKRLDKSDVPTHTRLITLGDYNERYVSKEEAFKSYQAATQVAPKERVTWAHLAGFHLRHTRWDDANAAAGQGLQVAPGDAALGAIQRVTPMLQANASRPGLGGLIEVLSRDPRNEAATQTLMTLDEARAANASPLALADKLAPLSGKYPRFLPLQILAMHTYLQARQPEEAAKIAARVMDVLPNAPDAARHAVTVYMAGGKWTDALAAARTWRERLPENPMAPDLAIAEAMLHLDNPSGAARTMQPYVKGALQQPDENSPIIITYAEALIRDGKSTDAAQLLRPLAEKSARWRGLWLRTGLTAFPAGRDADASAAWIGQLVSLIPANSSEDNLALAKAWYSHAKMFDRKESSEKARALLEPLAARPDAPTDVHMMLGATLEIVGDIKGAEQHYRKALELDPKLADVQNNLAYLLLTSGGDLAEAKVLTDKAIATAPAVAGFHDTLARIHAKSGQPDLAINSFRKALELDPSLVEALVGLAHLLAEKGQTKDAQTELDKAKTLLQGGTTASAEILKELEDTQKMLDRVGAGQ